MERLDDQKVTSDDHDEYFPSLNLALSLEPSSYYKVDVEEKLQVSSLSVVSSLSNSNFINSKRDIVDTSCCIQQLQVGRVVLDHDEDQSAAGRIKKLRLDTYQSRILEDSFNDHTSLNLKQKQALARRLNLRPRQVEVWYQNRRARNKLKQTEMECEMLKKCNDTLQDENRRLQKEAQQLMKEVKEKAPLCPFCNRITSSVTVSPAI